MYFYLQSVITISRLFIYKQQKMELESENPSILMVCMMFPNRALTIFDYEHDEYTRLPVGMGIVNENTLGLQIFNAYYEEFSNNFWLSLESDNKVRTIVEKTSLQATRSNVPLRSGMQIKRIPGTDYYNIIHNDLCLTVEDYKSIRADYYPLRFKPCINHSSQSFAFISHLKAKCFLKLTDCPIDKTIITNAELNIEKRIKQFEIQ